MRASAFVTTALPAVASALAASTVVNRALSYLLPHSPMANVLAGRTNVQALIAEISDLRQRAGIDAAVTHLETVPAQYKWINDRLREVFSCDDAPRRLVLWEADMDTRCYELPFLRDADVIEYIPDAKRLETKEFLIACRGNSIPLLARSVERTTTPPAFGERACVVFCGGGPVDVGAVECAMGTTRHGVEFDYTPYCDVKLHRMTDRDLGLSPTPTEILGPTMFFARKGRVDGPGTRGGAARGTVPRLSVDLENGV